MSRFAILENKEVKLLHGPEAVFIWAKFTDSIENKRVKHTVLPDGARVSTVFLGLDHGWEPGLSLWFETMVFGGANDGHIDRYETWDQAVRGHDRIVKSISKIGMGE